MGDSAASDLKQTPIFSRHEALGGRIVPFGGYALPVNYPSGIVAEHKWTREAAGLFDVSHMGPAFLVLADPAGDAEADHRAVSALVEPLICGDIAGLRPGQMRYTLLLNETGGVLDDLMIARPADPAESGVLYIVVNAGTKDADFTRIAAAAGPAARLERADEGGLFALQGPAAEAVAEALVPGASGLSFMEVARLPWQGHALMVARSGYTGEDGFEILLPPEAAGAFWDALLADARVRPAGLGARDSLRLEAGLPLYGHDLDETVSPIEAGLGFAVAKRRREAADFPGAARILAERETAPARIRVGLHVEGAPAREGAEIADALGTIVGVVTSGGFSPSLGRAIALGFVPPALSAPDTALFVLVRGRSQPARVVPTPFMPHRYRRRPPAR